jgi:putative FmdB family regulatory protein
MPIYEYRCSTCRHELEAQQKISDPALTDCPTCGTPTLTKKISAAGFQLKGTGWYATDFKGNGKPAAKTNGADKGGSDKGGSDKGGSESAGDKPAKTESKAEAPAACGPTGSCACS